MKLSPLTIYIIGASLFLIISSFAWAQYYQVNQRQSEFYRANLEQLNAEAAKQGQADKRLQKAVDEVKKADAAWQAIVAKKTPSSSLATGGIDLSVNHYQLSVDVRKFRNSVQLALNRQLKSGGVEIVSGPYVPGYNDTDLTRNILTSYFNVGTYSFPVVIYDLGQVTVTGTYKEITDHVRAWSKMPNYLAVADGLEIRGTSPNLTGTYNLQLVGFLKAKSFSPDVPEEAVAGGGAGGGANSPFGGGSPFGGPSFGGPSSAPAGPMAAPGMGGGRPGGAMGRPGGDL